MRAWIETLKSLITAGYALSHAVCVRGLKPVYEYYSKYTSRVARRVRAWIETSILCPMPSNDKSHAVCVRGLKQKKTDMFYIVYGSHAVCVRGLKRQ